jgi:fibronectin type 3 domain-containing protein
MMKNLLSGIGLADGKPGRLAQFAVAVLICWLHPATLLAQTINYVQGNSATPQKSQTTVSVKFNSAQIAGDLNVVAVGWNDSVATVSGITDTAGNAYTRAVGPTVISGVESQSIYCAKNIAAAAGANTVTVTFSSAAASPDIRILEYRGVDLNNPVDVTAASSGNSATSSSSAVTTTNPTDLIFGANLVQTKTTGPGSGFTSRLLTKPDGDIAEDQKVTATGSYSATAPLSSGQWIMQMVAFRTSVSGADTQPPTAPSGLTATVSGSQINLRWSASTDNVGVTGYRVERCQGAGCTAFAQIATPTATTYSDLGLGAGSYSYRVRATDAAGNLSTYSNVASGVIPDTQPPTAPSNLTATAASLSQINLAWTASTDNVAVTGYLVERCQGAACTTFAQIATPTTTTYNDTGLAANTSYNYRVRATDAAGNLSPYSNVASATTSSSSTTISYVQGNFATPQTTQTTVNVTFTAAQVAGDLNVVVVGWNDSTATVSNVTDARGNLYTRAVGPTVIPGVESQSIYYAKNIATAAVGANTVTVTFSTAAAYPDIRILEYSGADLNNPVDVTAANSGNSATSSSGTVTTTNPTDLLFGANIVQTITTGSGNGFTSRLLTTPDGDIAEDQMVAATGSYSATAPLSSGQWVMQMVAFRTPAGGGTSPSVNLSSTNLTFGNVQTGSTSSLQPVTLTNVGGGQLTISSIAVVGGNAGDFAQTNTCGATLAPNAACTINVTFTPTATGARSSTVTINDNAPGSPQTIALSGTGTGFSVTPRVSVLTFTGTQQFTASSGSVTWSVDGVIGGSSSSGTINATGLYTPPNTVGTHVVTATSAQSANATVYVTNYPGTFTYHNDNLRTGQNLNETVLTPANVNQAQFGKLFSYPLDGIAFASPLYLANINVPAQGFHNVVYVATEHDSVYAFEADGLSSAPLWKVSFLTSSVTPVPCADTGECGDIPTEIGITSTPVIDQASGTMYVVAKTKEGTRYFQRLHALDITTGAEKFSGPVVLQASVPGTGDGASGGKVSFDALRENQRSGLLLNNGVVYIAFASHGDQHPWHGWVLGYNATTLQQTMAYNVSPDGYGGGIWQSGGGLATDSTGNIFFSTGNGDFTANTGARDYGDTVVKLSPVGSVVDYFTPHDQANLESLDLDLSSAGPVLLLDEPGPNPHLLITAGKGGTIYVISRDNMGHFQLNSDNQIVQSLPGVLPHGTLEQGNYSAPVFFNNYVYFAAVNDTLKAFQLTSGLLSAILASQSSATYPNRGGSFAISANGSAHGILWATQDNNPGSGVLHAYDAGNLANELYNSNQAGSRDTLDVASKFNIPLVANGKVFVASNGQLTAFGLLP